MDNIRGNPIMFENENVKITRKVVECNRCIYKSVCPSVISGPSQCASFKDESKCISIKAAPGDTVWFTKWYNTPDGKIVSRTLLYISFYKDKTIYHCKDGAFDEDAFGKYAFMTLEAAKIISGMSDNIPEPKE